MIIFLIGYGLVAVPKLLLKLWSVEGRFQHAAMILATLDVQLMDAKFTLEHLFNTIYTLDRETTQAHPLRHEVDQLVALAGRYSHLGFSSGRRTIELDHEDRVVEHKRLVRLNKNLKEAITLYCKLHCQWELELEEAFLTQDVLAARDTHQRTLTSRLRRPRLGRCGFCCDRWEKILHLHLVRAAAIVGFFIAVILSAMVICGEMTILVKSWNFSFLGLFVKKESGYVGFHVGW